jgi:hypothetical protein
MRRVILAGLIALATATSTTGCFVNQYAADNVRRYRQLFFQSEDLRAIEDDMDLFWQLDAPSQLTHRMYHGFGSPAARSRFRY